MSLKNTQNTFVLGMFLGIIGGIAAMVLAFVAGLTKEPIEEAKMAKTNSALKEVLPEFNNSPGKNLLKVKAADDSGFEVTFYGALKDGKLVGIAGQSITKKGYSGKIQAMVGLEPDGKIRTVIITEQSETPGLGTVVCDRKRVVTLPDLLKGKKQDLSKLPDNEYLDQFDGKIAGDTQWKVKKDGGEFLYKTGATITSRAVTDVVYRIAHTYMANKKEIDEELAKGDK